jgi:protein-disulfide isomerase
VRLTLRHFPLSAAATEAARAGICAEGSGRLEEFHAHVFEDRRRVQIADWRAVAEAIGMSQRQVEVFRDCIASDSAQERLDRDLRLADELGVVGTPTFLLNDLRVAGFHGEVVMDSLVALALERRRSGSLSSASLPSQRVSR